MTTPTLSPLDAQDKIAAIARLLHHAADRDRPPSGRRRATFVPARAGAGNPGGGCGGRVAASEA